MFFLRRGASRHKEPSMGNVRQSTPRQKTPGTSWIALIACLLAIGFVAIPIAKACIEDSSFSLLDGELPGGG